MRLYSPERRTLDTTIELSEPMRVELLLELSGLSRQEALVVKACAEDSNSFEGIAKVLVDHYSGVHLREGKTLEGRTLILDGEQAWFQRCLRLPTLHKPKLYRLSTGCHPNTTWNRPHAPTNFDWWAAAQALEVQSSPEGQRRALTQICNFKKS